MLPVSLTASQYSNRFNYTRQQSVITFQRLLSLTLLLILFFCHCVSAQKASPINSDRPDQSDGTYTMPKNTFQLEAGCTLGKNINSYFLQTNMLRYGITKSTEIRILFDFGTVGSEKGIFAPGISVKQYLLPQKRWFPEISAVGYIRLPYLATDNFKTDSPAATFLLAFQNTITDQFSIGYNLGTTLDGDNAYNTWIVTASVAYQLTQKISFFLEYFSSFENILKPSSNIDTGVLWLLKDNFQIDLAIGTTITQDDKNRFVTTGISYSF